MAKFISDAVCVPFPRIEPPVTPEFTVEFHVTAYDDGGYGDNRSKEFNNREEAIAYARTMPANYGASVRMDVTMNRISVPVEWKEAVPVTDCDGLDFSCP